jgi:hypothetical protein
MNIDGTLLYCQTYNHPNKPQVLGRLLNNGDLLVLRFHSGTTILHSDRYSLECGCGFCYKIQGTIITGTMQL